MDPSSGSDSFLRAYLNTLSGQQISPPPSRKKMPSLDEVTKNKTSEKKYSEIRASQLQDEKSIERQKKMAEIAARLYPNNKNDP